jgi:Reverse transcriptase (RNA-dependent DNA polymerase)
MWRKITHLDAPAYALEINLQNQKKIGKWDCRSIMAVYIWASPHHAQSVGLLLSLRTGLVSPQFHIKYDDHFDTVREAKSCILPTSEWQVKCGFIMAPGESIQSPNGKTTSPAIGNIPDTEHLEEQGASDNQGIPQGEEGQMESSSDGEEEGGPQESNREPEQVTTRSGRVTKAPRKLDEYVAYETTPFDSSHESPSTFMDPMAYTASSDPDVMYYHEAMQQPDRVEFVRAMSKEITAHTENKNWKIIDRSRVPHGHDILPAIWAMRRKRRIDTQEVYKWKARINIHGGKQTKGVNYWDTYAPVATWASIRLVLNMAAVNGWETR